MANAVATCTAVDPEIRDRGWFTRTGSTKSFRRFCRLPVTHHRRPMDQISIGPRCQNQAQHVHHQRRGCYDKTSGPNSSTTVRQVLTKTPNSDRPVRDSGSPTEPKRHANLRQLVEDYFDELPMRCKEITRKILTRSNMTFGKSATRRL
jgi:hypothetical protein